MIPIEEKEYFRFGLDKVLGIVSSPQSNAIYASNDRLALCGALEAVHVWDMRTGTLQERWKEERSDTLEAEATLVVASPTEEDKFAVAYADGSVRIWTLSPPNQDAITNDYQKTALVTFRGHRGIITAMEFDQTGTRLITSGRDTDLVVWDLVGETGICRLTGHTSPITGVTMWEDRWIISTSRDTLLKVWDLNCQQCIETVVLHHAEITALLVLPGRDRLLTAAADHQLRLFEFSTESPDGSKLRLIETIACSSRDRIISLQARGGLIMAVADHSLGFWKMRTLEAYEKLQQKNKKSKPISWLKPVRHHRVGESKIKSAVFARNWSRNQSIKLLVNFADNRVGEMVVPLDASVAIDGCSSVLDLQGHRSEGRVLSFNADGTLLATASRESIKIWNSARGSLMLTIPVEKVTAMTFFPNEGLDSETSMLAADETGQIHHISLATAQIVESVQAHEGAIRCLTVQADGRGMATGGADRMIKFWEWKRNKLHGAKLDHNTDDKQKAQPNRLWRLKLIRSLQLGDEPTALRFSPDGRYVAVGLLDLTIKIFFTDSLKFYLSLYGHKLPITAIDIAPDSKLLLSASADKNIKVWSLEFGECRRSVFGHGEAITGIAFIPGTRFFFTSSKDHHVKFWDLEGGGNIKELQKFTSGAHHGEVWALSVSPQGDCLATVSRDRSIRIWRQSTDLLFPEEEQEREMEQQIEQSLLEDNPHGRDETKDGSINLRTVASMKAGERIMEFIEAADDERRKWQEYETALSQNLPGIEEPTPGPLVLLMSHGKGATKTPAELVLTAFDPIPMPEVEDALLCLPLRVLPSLLFYIQEWLRARRNIVLATRILDFTLRLFLTPIMASPSLRSLLLSIRDLQRETLQELRDMVGFNSMVIRAEDSSLRELC